MMNTLESLITLALYAFKSLSWCIFYAFLVSLLLSSHTFQDYLKISNIRVHKIPQGILCTNDNVQFILALKEPNRL